MKLNNKGFAITAVLYGLLILFVILIGSYLTLLATKKNRLDSITSDVESKYELGDCIEVNNNISYPYYAPHTGKYVFEKNCIKYLYRGTNYKSDEINCSGKLIKICYSKYQEGEENE